MRRGSALLGTFCLCFSPSSAAHRRGVYRYRQSQPAAISRSAPARQGDFLVIIRCRGELKAGAPFSLCAHGPQPPHRLDGASRSNVKQGDTHRQIRFLQRPADSSMQKEAALRQAQATLDQALAQAKITSEQDKTDLADANFTVERARLEASKQEIVSRIQGEESKIDLGVAAAETQSSGGHRRSARHLR